MIYSLPDRMSGPAADAQDLARPWLQVTLESGGVGIEIRAI